MTASSFYFFAIFFGIFLGDCLSFKLKFIFEFFFGSKLKSISSSFSAAALVFLLSLFSFSGDRGVLAGDGCGAYFWGDRKLYYLEGLTVADALLKIINYFITYVFSSVSAAVYLNAFSSEGSLEVGYLLLGLGTSPFFSSSDCLPAPPSESASCCGLHWAAMCSGYQKWFSLLSGKDRLAVSTHSWNV